MSATSLTIPVERATGRCTAPGSGHRVDQSRDSISREAAHRSAPLDEQAASRWRSRASDGLLGRWPALDILRIVEADQVGHLLVRPGPQLRPSRRKPLSVAPAGSVASLAKVVRSSPVNSPPLVSRTYQSAVWLWQVRDNWTLEPDRPI